MLYQQKTNEPSLPRFTLLFNFFMDLFLHARTLVRYFSNTLNNLLSRYEAEAVGWHRLPFLSQILDPGMLAENDKGINVSRR